MNSTTITAYYETLLSEQQHQPFSATITSSIVSSLCFAVANLFATLRASKCIRSVSEWIYHALASAGVPASNWPSVEMIAFTLLVAFLSAIVACVHGRRQNALLRQVRLCACVIVVTRKRAY
jgi:hypothetical protein